MPIPPLRWDFRNCRSAGPLPRPPSASAAAPVSRQALDAETYRVLSCRAALRHVRTLAARQRKEFVREQVWSWLDGELERLPEACRSPIVLCYLEGRSLDEAVSLLAWSPGKVRRGLECGREALQRRLACRGVRISSATLARLLSRDAQGAGVSLSLITTTLHAAVQSVAGKPGAFANVSRRVAALARQSLKLLRGW